MILTIEQIAEIAHNVNKAYCEALGDFNQKPWSIAEDWQKKSCIEGIQYLLENVDTTPAESHMRWLSSKKADGWVYGEVKDAEKKIHPCMKPYDELPTEQKAKDFIFMAVIYNLVNL